MPGGNTNRDLPEQGARVVEPVCQGQDGCSRVCCRIRLDCCIPQGKHGSVSLKEVLGGVQQRRAKGFYRFIFERCCGRSRVNRGEVGAVNDDEYSKHTGNRCDRLTLPAYFCLPQ